MIRFLLGLFICFPTISFGQNPKLTIHIEVKPEDPRKGYEFDIAKADGEIKIVYRKIDSIGKVPISSAELEMIDRLTTKKELDSLEGDKLYRLQMKLDSLKKSHTFYSSESTTIYKSTHKDYWQLLETIASAPDEVLTKKQGNQPVRDNSYSFFTIFRPALPNRYLFIESMDAKAYPLLVRLVNQTREIIWAYQEVMKRKN